MIGKSNFLKRLGTKASKSTFNLEKVKKQGKNDDHSQQQLQILKSDIKEFQFIGIFDKKVIVTFHQRLQIFGLFDLHAIHERIRYEYYSNRILNSHKKITKNTFFDEQAIEKEGKSTFQIYGELKHCLLRVDGKFLSFFKENQNKVEILGIELQKNSNNEVYVTSHKPILGKELSLYQINQVLEDVIQKRNIIPKIIDDWIGEFSCKSAYKFNDNLPALKAVLLISNLQKCDYPWYCVHGRNTVHIKTLKSLSP